MAPKRRSAAIAVPSSSPPARNADVNTEILLQVEQQAAKILEHPVFKNLAKAKPLGIEGHGSGAAFDLEAYQGAMKNGQYTCQINLFWLDVTFIAMCGVPLRARAASEWVSSPAFDDCRFQPVIEVAVVGEASTYNPLEHKGALKRMSPPEQFFGLIMRVHRDIQEEKPTEVLKRWRKCFLDITARFICVKTREDMWWHEFNARELLGSQYETMCQTTYQKLCGLLKMIEDRASEMGKEAATQAKIVQLYESRARLAISGRGTAVRETAESFIREAFSIKEMFERPAVHAAIKELDTSFGHSSPLNSVYKLGNIKKACQTLDMIEWTVLALKDNIFASVEAILNVSLNDMKPGKTKCIPKCYVLKKQLLEHLLRKADEMYPTKVSGKMNDIFASHGAYRQLFRPLPVSSHQPRVVTCDGQSSDPSRTETCSAGCVPAATDSIDLTFLAEWPASARHFVEFVAATVFTHEAPYAHGFQSIAKLQKPMMTLFEHAPFKEAWDRIVNAWEEERKAAVVKTEAC